MPGELDIRCRPAGRDQRGRRIPGSPHAGCVIVEITKGAGKGKGVQLNWEAAKDFARALRSPEHALRASSQSVLRAMHVGNGAVVVERREPAGFKPFFSLMPNPAVPEAVARAQLKDAVKDIADAITNVACEAEQDLPAVAMRVAEDHAIALRSGFPLGMTADPQILAEAKHMHDTDEKLRRYLPHSALEAMPTQRASIRLPMPSLKMGPPEPAAALRAQAAKMTPEEQRELLRMLDEQIAHGG